MKKTLTFLSLIALVLALLASCGVPREGLWEDAVYTTGKTLGEGNTSFLLEVSAGDTSVTFTVKTDEKMLGQALRDCGIVEGDEGPFGLYIKRVNGILADYDTDGSWWGLLVNGVSSPVGVDSVEIKEGSTYTLKYSK